ncbi:MAG TPA: 23S rRNA (guanosine(2251)-2'-O)-methyltransferase RlmB [Candidatus Dormibacteraeota bacterium]|nr:23S rRNA (guanosine(2251)-2'-O)-methyltransferase RlmB [Candidatus Dormibacteraeota bacterium]
MNRPPSLVYGRNPVREALRAGRGMKRLVVAEGLERDPRLDEIMALAAERGVPVETADRRRVEAIAHSDAHQGVVAYVHRRVYLDLDEVLDGADPLLVLLDGVQDPQNLGSICRTAEAAGVSAVVVARTASAEVTAAVAKASAGAVEHIRIAQVGRIAQAVERLHEAGFWIVGLAGEGEMAYDRADYRGRAAIVVGAEGEGLHHLVRERCDQLVRLPMLGKVESLNAGVAAAIVMYEALRQRSPAAEPPGGDQAP